MQSPTTTNHCIGRGTTDRNTRQVDHSAQARLRAGTNSGVARARRRWQLGKFDCQTAPQYPSMTVQSGPCERIEIPPVQHTSITLEFWAMVLWLRSSQPIDSLGECHNPNFGYADLAGVTRPPALAPAAPDSHRPRIPQRCNFLRREPQFRQDRVGMLTHRGHRTHRRVRCSR